jgi:hypothetical protein
MERNMTTIKTLEPLLITPKSDPDDERYYVLPTGTFLHIDEGMAEGHVRYSAHFYHKGQIAHEDVPMKPEYQGNYIAPLWLYNVDADTLYGLCRDFPLSKRDVISAVKANEMTREDLIDIIRSLPE